MMWNSLLVVSTNTEILISALNILIRAVILLIPCVIGSLIRYKVNPTENSSMSTRISYAIVPAIFIAGVTEITSENIGLVIAVSGLVGLISKDLVESLSTIRGLVNCYNSFIKIATSVKNKELIDIEDVALLNHDKTENSTSDTSSDSIITAKENGGVSNVEAIEIESVDDSIEIKSGG